LALTEEQFPSDIFNALINRWVIDPGAEVCCSTHASYLEIGFEILQKIQSNLPNHPDEIKIVDRDSAIRWIDTLSDLF